MIGSYNEVRVILEGIPEISDNQFNRLIDVYGEDLILSVIKGIVSQNSNLDDKFKNRVEQLEIIIRNKNKKDDVKKENLYREIYILVQKIEEIFDRYNDGQKITWLGDKIDYCISKCSDSLILEDIEKTYKEYVDKRNIVIQDNMSLVRYFVETFWTFKNGIEYNDYLQWGYMGMMRAVEKYNPDNGVEFCSYAVYWIKSLIVLGIRKMGYQMIIPGHIYDLNSKRIKTIDRLVSELGRMPTRSEIADSMEITESKLGLLEIVFDRPIYLDDECVDEIDDVTMDEVDIISDNIADNSFDILSDVYLKELKEQIVRYMKENLTDREIYVLRNRFGFDRQMTNVMLAKEMGVSGSRTDQIRRNAFDKLLRDDRFKKLRLYLR